jgi:co-chaperonin GroES (HSP10)
MKSDEIPRMRNDNVLIRVIPEPERLQSGLLFRPRSVKTRTDGTIRGKVLAVGPGHRISGGRGPIQPTGLEVGDLIICRALAGEKVEDFAFDNASERQNAGAVDGDLRMIRAEECLGVIEDCTEEDLAGTSTAADEYTVQHHSM